MRTLVTGAFGFVGGRIAQALRRTGSEVVLVGHSVPPWAHATFAGCDLRSADMLDEPSLRAVVDRADAVVHLAALNERESEDNPALALRVRDEGTRNLLRAAAAARVARVVFISTFHVYRPGDRIDETSPTAPTGPYGIAQLAGERACRDEARADGVPRVVILRVSNVYGCPIHEAIERWTLAHNDFCRQAVRSSRIVLRSPGIQRRDLVWVEDVAAAVRLAIAARPADLGEAIFNAGGEKSLSIVELAEAVRRRAERRMGQPVGLEVPASDVCDEPLIYSIERIRRLGYRPHDALDLETDAIIDMLRTRGE